MQEEDQNSEGTNREDTTPGEHSFDELARGLADGTISRSRALKLIGAAILGSVLGFYFDRRASLAQEEEAGELRCFLLESIGPAPSPEGGCVLCTSCLVCCSNPDPLTSELCLDAEISCADCRSVPCPEPPVAANAGETFASADIQQAAAASGDVSASAGVELDVLEDGTITFTPAPEAASG